MVSETDNIANKRRVRSFMDALAASTPETVGARLAEAYHPQAQWRGSHPWNELQGLAAIEQQFWRPFLHSFPDLERRDSLLIGGSYEGRDYVGAVGHLAARFRRDWQGIPATDQVVYWRYGEFHQMQDGRIIQSTVLLDVLDVIGQTGHWPLPPSRGAEGRCILLGFGRYGIPGVLNADVTPRLQPVHETWGVDMAAPIRAPGSRSRISDSRAR